MIDVLGLKCGLENVARNNLGNEEVVGEEYIRGITIVSFVSDTTHLEGGRVYSNVIRKSVS